MFISDPSIDINGTYLQGEVMATRKELISVFGNPTEYPEGDKVTTEWCIKFDNGLVASIYDWKRYEQGAPELDEIYDWHIGGTSVDVVSLVKDAIHRSNTNVIA
jgi:hypothetical protein